MRCPRSLLPALILLLVSAAPLRAIEVRISAHALQFTLQKQLFKDAQNRYYLRGSANEGCSLYAQDPKVSFRDNRIVVRVTIHGQLGKMMFGHCIGIPIHTTPEVSLVPVAHGEVVGFQDAQIDSVSDNGELNALAMPFMKNKLPKSMEVNVAEQLRKILNDSGPSLGYDFTLKDLNLVTLAVQGDHLFLNVEAKLLVD